MWQQQTVPETNLASLDFILALNNESPFQVLRQKLKAMQVSSFAFLSQKRNNNYIRTAQDGDLYSVPVLSPWKVIKKIKMAFTKVSGIIICLFRLFL